MSKKQLIFLHFLCENISVKTFSLKKNHKSNQEIEISVNFYPNDHLITKFCQLLLYS